MKFSTKQIKTFLRIQRKHNVSVNSLLRDMPAILKFVQYAITPHIVLKRKLIRKRNRVFLRNNYIRKLIIDPLQLKRKQKAKRLHSQWSKRLVMYLRRNKIVEFFEDEIITKNEMPEVDVSKQLKEQLELLKSGKRTVPLLQDIQNVVEEHKNKQLPTLTLVDKPSEMQTDETEEISTETEWVDLEKSSNLIQTQSVAVINDNFKSPVRQVSQDVDSTRNKSEILSGNFLDMLISKVTSTTDDVTETVRVTKTTMESPKIRPRAKTEDRMGCNEHENSNSSSDFCGFDDNERILGNYPGMLSTPFVQKSDFNSAFESETLNAYMRDNSLGSLVNVDFPQRRLDDGLVCANSIPPKLDMPAIPEELQCMRTVAERRSFFQRNKNMKYCIINNVGTIYRELQKRIKGHRINRHAIEALQSSRSVPFTRQGWKATAWLLTDEGNYYFQTINIDGKDYRLFGCQGNNENKFKKPHFSKYGKASTVCTDICVDRLTFRALRLIRNPEKRSKLFDSSLRTKYKACPLSKKILLRSQEDEPVFNSLQIVRMPNVELEVFPQLQKPLSDIAKRYLQLILPYDGISREWAEFSVSTLIEHHAEGLSATPRQSYTFTIPYTNDRNHVLVRRVYNRLETFEGPFDNSKLTFRKEIDQKQAGGETCDPLAEECADILTDMLNSVAITCSENSFLKNDPDNIYQNTNDDDELSLEKSVKKPMEVNQNHTVAHSKKQSRLLMELKRLNATIIDAAASKLEEEGRNCTKKSCKLGCVCSSLNEGNTLRSHCGKHQCVLECICKRPAVMRLETDGRAITTEDALMLRRQATAKLARMEKEFTSTIVLTESETLLINESQYDKKRRCTKVPKRYGDFVDPDQSDLNDNTFFKKPDCLLPIDIPQEPIMVNENVYKCLKHCTVNVKRLRDFKNLVPWCMVHSVYKCHCKGQATIGNPIIVAKQEEPTESRIIDNGNKNRTLYSFETEEIKANEDVSNCYESESIESDGSDSLPLSNCLRNKQHSRGKSKRDKRGRMPDNDLIEAYTNAKANHCRRIVPIPRNIYQRRNKKRAARVQLYIAENETDETRLSLNEHVLRSVYYHKSNLNQEKQNTVKVSNEQNDEDKLLIVKEKIKQSISPESSTSEKRKHCEEVAQKDNAEHAIKKRRMSFNNIEEGSSLLRVNRYKELKKLKANSSSIEPDSSEAASLKSLQNKSQSQSQSQEITVPKISHIFSLNENMMELEADTEAVVNANICNRTHAEETSTDMANDPLQNVFQVVIKNMNNLVSRKMQDIDMALRRESRAIPVPNDEILCIIRWNNFLEAFRDGFVFLWEVRTVKATFIAATIKNLMPLVMNALSVVNIRALPKEGLPLLGRMLLEGIKNEVTESLAVVMQGQKMYWFVKGFLRPDKTRVCPKPTPESHPLLTKKINILCRLLINQQINEHKKRQEADRQINSSPGVPALTLEQETEITPLANAQNKASLKLKVLPMQRNLSDHANNILENMVISAYGLFRTNVAFRRFNQHEIKEVLPPAHMIADHYWLVLDVCNDFSHIYVPELKDLLTLDRIQKVMSYAVTKNRIVKMQFSLKSPFQAYVTPLSRRKLYFGPFRNTNNAPKLILLQSVDGTMMLREVYESRHKVAARANKTTALWLVQKRGKIYLDVEAKSTINILQGVPEQDLQEIIEGRACNVPTQEEIAQPQNVSTAENDKIPIEKYIEEDDDCIIVESESEPGSSQVNVLPNPEMINYTISYTGENSLLVVPNTAESSYTGKPENVANGTFTILTSETERSSNSTVVSENSLPSKPIEPQSSQVLEPKETDSVEKSKTGNNTIKPSGDIHSNGIASVPKNNSNSISNMPTIKSLLTSKPLEAKTCVGLMKNSEGKPIELSNTFVENSNGSNLAVSKKLSDTNSKLKQLSVNPMKWNKSVTITKVSMDSEQAPPTTNPVKLLNTTNGLVSPGQRDYPATSNSNLVQNQPNQRFRLISPNQKLQTGPMTIGQPRVPNSQVYRIISAQPSQIVQKSLKINTSPTLQQVQSSSQRSNTLKNVTVVPRTQTQKTSPSIINQQNLSTSSHESFSPRGGGLTVRTPLAINTLIGSQHKKQTARQTSNNSAETTLLMSSNKGQHVEEAIATTSSGAVQPPKVFKDFPQSVILKNQPARNSGPIQISNIVKPTSSPPKPIIKRVLTHSQLFSESLIQNKIKKFISDEKPTESDPSDQEDPLHIPDEDLNTGGSNLLQPTLSKDLKPVIIKANPIQARGIIKPLLPVSSANPNLNRSVRTQLLGQYHQVTDSSRTNSSTVVTTVNNSLTTKTSQIKGIPIELPRLKKFAIVNSANTTVITPPTSQQIDARLQNESRSSANASTSESISSNLAEKKKIVATGLIKCYRTSPNIYPAGNNNSKTTDVSKIINVPQITTKLQPEAEYGYFHSNMEGLPKFVVKRVNDDYLIKVPNFNGILKLTGMATVINYLNQYTTQKCGKTAEEVANLRWTFVTQDRSKLNSIHKMNPVYGKSDSTNSTPAKQLIPVTRVLPASASPIIKNNSSPNITNNVKPPTAGHRKAESSDSIVVLDNE